MEYSRALTHGSSETEFQWYAEQFSRPLFVHSYSEPEELQKAVTSLCFRTRIQPREVTIKGIGVLVLDLYARFVCSDGGFSTIGVFTSNGPITGDGSQQYRYLGFSGSALKRYLEKFEKLGLVETFPGIPGHSTKVRGTDLLIRTLEERYKFSLEKIRYRRINPTVYTNHLGENVGLEVAHAERSGSKALERYNELLRNADIQVGGKYILPFEKQVRRIFKDAEGTTDGRHYGPIWQVLPSRARSRIRINGDNVSECDIKSAHPLIAYALAHKDLTEMKEAGFDPYQLPQISSSDKYRELVKKASLMMFNCSSQDQARKSLQSSINKTPELHLMWKSLTESGIGIDSVIQWIADNNQPISKYLFSGSWDLFNYHESNIAQRVIEHFLDKGIVVITVFDSFIVQSKYMKELEEVLATSIAVELMMIFRNPDKLIEWSDVATDCSDSEAEMELTKARTYRDRMNR